MDIEKFNKAANSAKFISKLNENLFSNDAIQMMQQQQLWINRLSALTVPEALQQNLKNFKAIKSFTNLDLITKLNDLVTPKMVQQNMLADKNFNSLAHIVSMHDKLSMPLSAVNMLKEMNTRNENMFSVFRNASYTAEKYNILQYKAASLQFAFDGISAQISATAIAKKNWDLIKDLNHISEQVSEISESIVSNDPFEKEEINKRFSKLINMLLTIAKKKNLGVGLLILLLGAIDRFIAYHQYYDFLKTKPELATNKNVQIINDKVDSLSQKFTELSKMIHDQAKDQKEYRTTIKACNVMLKPRLRSQIIAKLPIDFDLVILQTHHKWAWVSFINSEDNLPEAGWILKKYLIKP